VANREEKPKLLKITYVGALLFFCLGIVGLYISLMARKRAVAEQAKIHRLFDAAKRALILIESEDDDKILVGLQLLSVYDIGSIRMKAFPRLMQLSNYQNKQIAELAKHVIRLSQSASENEIAQTKAS
jgi:hypothetical protein